jgi:N4-gp56 family major capsid protein
MASPFSWTFDAPSGTFKSHEMSEALYTVAIEDSVFMDHVKPVPEFGRKMGETITLKRVSAVSEPTSADLVEGIRIPEDILTVTTRAITVGEIGRSVPYTSLAEDLSALDLENSIQSELKRQMTLVLDTKSATAFKNAKVKYAITGPTSNNIATNGTFGATSTDNMNVYHAEEIRDYMYDTLQVPELDGGDYVGIFRTLGIRGLKRDPDWEEWHKYTDPAAKFNSEVGRMERIRFIETNHNKALGKVGSGSVLGEGVVFGADAVAMIEALTPELRAALPGDFGREKSVAWYGVVAMDTIWDTGNAGQARIVHVGSL